MEMSKAILKAYSYLVQMLTGRAKGTSLLQVSLPTGQD